MFLKAPWESSGVFREMIKDNFPLFDLFHPRIRGQFNLKCCDYFFKQNKILTLISLQNLILIISPFSSPHRSLCCIQVRQLVAPKAEKGDFDLSVSVSRLTMSVGDDDDDDENDLFSNFSSPTKQQCSAQRPRFWLGLVCSAILHHILMLYLKILIKVFTDLNGSSHKALPFHTGDYIYVVRLIVVSSTVCCKPGCRK